jgi:hypothetical protein
MFANTEKLAAADDAAALPTGQPEELSKTRYRLPTGHG